MNEQHKNEVRQVPATDLQALVNKLLPLDANPFRGCLMVFECLKVRIIYDVKIQHISETQESASGTPLNGPSCRGHGLGAGNSRRGAMYVRASC